MTPERHTDYPHCLAWAGRHWQSEADLQTVLETLRAFQTQRDLLSEQERGNYEATVRAAPWRVSAEGAADTALAVRWLDTPEEAQTLLSKTKRRPLRLSISELGPAVAHVLAGHTAELALPGVQHLDWPAAQALAQRPPGRWRLTLGQDSNGMDGFAGLEPYWSRPDAYLCLPALTRLNDESAEVLSRIRGTLNLPNLRQLSPAHAAQLVSGSLIKLELDHLPDAALTPELAQALTSGQLNELALNRITHEAAGLSQLAAHAWSVLQLDGLRQLPLTLADTLRQAGLLYLKLNGLPTLDLPTARALCGNARAFSLYLNGLTHLDDAVVGVLVDNSNSLLEIRQVEKLSPTARRMLYDQGNVECPVLD